MQRIKTSNMFGIPNLMKKYTYYLLFFSTLIFSCWHCSCDRKEPDPCKDIPSSTAEFTSTDLPSFKLFADTFFNNNTVFFKAKDTTANSYEWQFGYDPKKYTKSYKQKLTFDETALGAIKANLKIKKKKSTYSCYPNDDSVKTYSKNIFFVSQENIPYLGWWKGSFNNKPNDTFSFEIRKVYNNDTQKYTDVSLVGFPPHCDSVEYHRYSYTSYIFFTLSWNSNSWNSKPSKQCSLDNGIVYSKLDGYYDGLNKKLTISYLYNIYNYDEKKVDRIPLTFSGIRLNK